MYYKFKAFFIVICMLLLCDAMSQEPDSLYYAQGVRQIAVQTYQVKNAKIKHSQVYSMDTVSQKDYRKFVFNADGGITMSARCLQNGTPAEFYSYEYDHKQQLTERVHTFQLSLFGGRQKYDYDRQGNKIRTTIYNNKNELYRTITYKYENGRIVEEKTFNSANMVIYHRNMRYDTNGNLVYFINRKTALVKDNDQYSFRQEFIDNKLVKKEYYNAGDTLITRWEYTYDNQKNLLSEKQYDITDLVIKAEYKTYNKKGDMITHQINDVQKKSRVKMQYTYYKNHQVKSMKVYVNNDSRPQYQKQWYYDMFGNWVLWVEKDSKNTIIALSQRQIEYEQKTK